MSPAIAQLITTVDVARRRLGLSYYKLALKAGVSIDATERFFLGAAGQRSPDAAGRVHFDTAVRLVEACGLRLQTVGNAPEASRLISPAPTPLP